MRKIFEPAFDILYLAAAALLGLLTLLHAEGRPAFVLFGLMDLVLAAGDAFHLVPRTRRILRTGSARGPGQGRELGGGLQITSITMTFFYLLVHAGWQILSGAQGGAAFTALLSILAAVRVVLCLLPGNMWKSDDPPAKFAVLRNIPFLMTGAAVSVRFGTFAAQAPGPLRLLWLAVALSFAFYLPVVLFARKYPAVGMLMIPKTCCYVWIMAMCLRAASS